MRLTRKELEQIILENLSEESFMDKVKSKGKDLGAKIKSKGQDIKDKVSSAFDKDDSDEEEGEEPKSNTTGASAAEEEIKSPFERLTTNSKFILAGNDDKLRLVRGGGDVRPNVTFMFTDDSIDMNKAFFRAPGSGSFSNLTADGLVLLGLISNDAPDDMKDEMLKSLRDDLRSKFDELGGKSVTTDQVGGKIVGDRGGSTRTSTDLKESESLSRGSLYRRRYYGRY